MRIAVLGCGAMGSIYAAFLSARHEVVALLRKQESIDAINSKGLRLQNGQGELMVRLPAMHVTSTQLGHFDLVIIATKAKDVPEAARRAAKILKDDGLVLSIQNGIGCGDQLEELLGNRVFLGIASNFGACVPSLGHASYQHLGRVLMGDWSAGNPLALERLVNVWKGTALPVEAVEDIQQVIWKKLINNCANVCCTICQTNVGEMMADEHSRSVGMECAREAFHVARVKGILPANFDVEQHVTAFNKNVAGAQPSLLQDFLAGRPCEIEHINGAIPMEAAKVGLTAPVNATVSALVRALEAKQARTVRAGGA